MKRDYQVIFRELDDGWVMATAPELPGAITQGRDLNEARAMIKEAIELLLASYRDHAQRDAGVDAISEQLTVDVPAA